MVKYHNYTIKVTIAVTITDQSYMAFKIILVNIYISK